MKKSQFKTLHYLPRLSCSAGTLAASAAALLLLAGSASLRADDPGDNREPDFASLEPYVVRVFKLLLPIKTLSLVNVNLPEKPKGIRWTRQSVRHYDGKVVPDKDPAGRPIFWFTVTPLEGAAEGTDRWAVEHGWASITPLRLDLTDEADLARALALSDTPATKVSGKRRQQRRSSSTSSSKTKSSSRGQK